MGHRRFFELLPVGGAQKSFAFFFMSLRLQRGNLSNSCMDIPKISRNTSGAKWRCGGRRELRSVPMPTRGPLASESQAGRGGEHPSEARGPTAGTAPGPSPAWAGPGAHRTAQESWSGANDG